MTESRTRKISMKDIEQNSIVPETLHGMIPPPLVNHLNFDGMADYGNNILLDLSFEITDLKPHTKNIFSIWPPSPDQYQKRPKLSP